MFKINNSICQTETVDISKTGFRKKKKYTRKKQTNKKTQLHICALHQHRGINSEQRFMKLNLITCRKGNRS